MAFAKGDVVLVPFPFRDRAATKVRPATTHPPRFLSDYALTGWKQARLMAPSTVRMQFATLASSRVLYRPGKITAGDLHAVDARIRQAFDL